MQWKMISMRFRVHVCVCIYMQWKMISMRWRIYENEAKDCAKVTREKRACGDNNEAGREGGRKGGREREREREREIERNATDLHACI